MEKEAFIFIAALLLAVPLIIALNVLELVLFLSEAVVRVLRRSS